MRAFNPAADWLAGEAFRLKTDNKVELQQLYYCQLRDDFGLSAQMAIRCIAQVCEAYGRDKSIRPRSRKYASIPYDQRLMSFKGLDRVSLLTLEGRVIVPVVMGKRGVTDRSILRGTAPVLDPTDLDSLCKIR